MRDFIITIYSEDEKGTLGITLMDYHFNLFPTHNEVIDAFLKKKGSHKNVSILSIMEFSKEDYERFVSEK